MSHSIEASWQLDEIDMSATIVCPDGSGPFPGVVIVAGSGPTDRDWCSPLLPGTNGSARLLAEAFADAGIASLRYDKRASGPHARESAARLIGRLSMQSHLNELVAAVETLAAQTFIDTSRIVGLGNSEGTLHVLHYATSDQRVPFAAVVLVAPPGRPVSEVLLSQLAQQAALIPGGAELMPMVEAAAARYSAGQPMDADPRLPDSVRMVLASFEAPANLPLARELWNEDAGASLPRLSVPCLVIIGGRDAQIDTHADGDPLQAANAGMSNMTFSNPANANHVLKQDLRSEEDWRAAPGVGYNEDGTRLDPDAIAAILGWLRDHDISRED